MATLASLVVRVLADTSGVAPGFGAAVAAAEGFGGKLSAVGKAAQTSGLKLTTFATVPLALIGNKAIDASSALTESINAIEVTFGEAASKIKEFGETSETTVGLSTRAFNQLVTPVGAGLLNVGFSADQAADASINLAKRAADMASVFDVEVSDAMTAVQAGLRGQSRPLRRFGVDTRVAALEAFAMSQGINKAWNEMNQQEQAALTLNAIMAQTDRIENDFINTSDELANQLRISAAAAENDAAVVGDKLVPVKAKLDDVVTNLIDKFANLPDGIQNAILVFGVLAAALGPVLLVLGSLIRVVGGVAKTGVAFARFGAGVASGLRGVSAAAEGANASTARTFGAMIGNAARATASVVASVVRQVAHWALLGVQALLHAAKVAAAWLISLGPIGLVIAVVAGAVALIIKYWDEISGAITAAVRFIVDFVKNHWDLLVAILLGPLVLGTRLIIQHWDQIKAITMAAVSAVIGFVSELPGRILGALSSFAGIVRDVAQRGWDLFLSTTSRIVGAVIGFVREVPGRIFGALSALPGLIRDAATRAWNGFLDAARTGAAKVFLVAAEIPGRILSGIGDLGGLLFSAGKALIQGLVNGIKSLAGAVAGAVKDAVGGAVSIGKKILGIGSPSKVFAEIGRDVAAGMALGLARSEHLVTGAVASLAGTTTDLEAFDPHVAVPPPGGGAMVTFDFAGADSELARALRKMVRVEGRGDVQVAFGA